MAVVWSTAANTTLWCVLHGKSVLRGTFDAEATQVSEANASVRQVVNLTGQLRMKTDQWPLRMIKDQQANKMSLIRKPICHGETSLHRKKKKKKKKGKKKKKKERKKERKKTTAGDFLPLIIMSVRHLRAVSSISSSELGGDAKTDRDTERDYDDDTLLHKDKDLSTI